MHRDARKYSITCIEMPCSTTLHAQCCQAVIFVISSDARLNNIISTDNQDLLHYMYSDGRLDYTERNAKNHRPLQSTVLEKIKKNCQKLAVFNKKCIFGYFRQFFLIFSRTVLCRGLRSFALRSVSQNAKTKF